MPPHMQGRVQFSELINASVLLFGRTIKYCVTNMARRSQNRARKFPTSLSTLSYKTPVFPTDSTLQYHKSNTLALINSLNWTLPCSSRTRLRVNNVCEHGSYQNMMHSMTCSCTAQQHVCMRHRHWKVMQLSQRWLVFIKQSC